MRQKYLTITCLLFLGAALAAGCAYERRVTTLYAVYERATTAESLQPEHLWTLTIISAQIPPTKPAGLNWDNDGTGPDPYVRLYVNEQLVWESPVIENTLEPVWNRTLPRNVMLHPDSALRFELWDRDTVASSDPIGRIRRNGLPATAQPNSVTRLVTDMGAVLSLKVSPPRAHEGVGITSFEVRPTCLVALKVEQYSPAGRAGIRNRDKITAIDGHSVEALGDPQAATMLSLAAERGYTLDVVDWKGAKRQVKLDSGYVWLTM